MSSQFDHIEIVFEETLREDARSLPTKRPSVYGALGRVWMLAATIFLASGLFFYLMTGVIKMLLPLAFLALGLGFIGCVQVVAKAHIARRSGN